MREWRSAKTFLGKEIGDMSTLSPAEQEKEMQWFIDAAKPFKGMEIKVVSESLTTHQYESQVLAPAFTAITGIKVTTTSSRKATSSRRSRRRCRPARTFMTAG